MLSSVADTMAAMGRWEPDAAGRLVEAALTLFAERGFDQTTAEEIAKAAGLTERTFFRYFADKREVLFHGSDELRDRLAALVADAPLSVSPIDAVVAALKTAGTQFEERRQFARRRHAVIAASPELRERELIKLQTIASALAQALRGHGVDDTAAVLAAEAGVAVFRVAFDRWVADSDRHHLSDVIEASLGELRAVTAPTA